MPTAETLVYNGKNQINGLVYDAAGDLIDDGSNQYLYDAEGRVLPRRSYPHCYCRLRWFGMPTGSLGSNFLIQSG